MATKQDLPVTDSAAVLHDLVGDDATAAFESNPTFIDSSPATGSSSENLQIRKDRGDFQNLPDMKAARIKALDEEDDVEDEEDEDDDDDEFEDVETEDDDDEDEDDDVEDDDEDDDLEDDDEDDDDDDDEDEDDEDDE